MTEIPGYFNIMFKFLDQRRKNEIIFLDADKAFDEIIH